MSFFSEEDRQRIAHAIQAAEKETGGEILAIVTGKSDDYRYIALLWASLIALAVPPVLLLFPQLTNWQFAFRPPEVLYFLQVLVFVILAFLFQWGPIRFRLVPKAVRQARAHRNAVAQFLAHAGRDTSRPVIMIFVSIAERHAEILGDADLAERVDPERWQAAVDRLTAKISAQQPVEGFLEAIAASRDILKDHAPRKPTTRHSLPDHLIEIESS